MADPAELIAARLRNAVEFAAGIFESYAQMHEAKGTPEGERKAHVNAGYAKEMRAALTTPAPTQVASADAGALLIRAHALGQEIEMVSAKARARLRFKGPRRAGDWHYEYDPLLATVIGERIYNVMVRDANV